LPAEARFEETDASRCHTMQLILGIVYSTAACCDISLPHSRPHTNDLSDVCQSLTHCHASRALTQFQTARRCECNSRPKFCVLNICIACGIDKTELHATIAGLAAVLQPRADVFSSVHTADRCRRCDVDVRTRCLATSRCTIAHLIAGVNAFVWRAKLADVNPATVVRW
jgi:hypothetical protein